MKNENTIQLLPPEMSTRVFGKLSTFITERLGIKLPTQKKTMLQSRVLKRLKALGLKNYEDYCEYLFSPEGMADELDHLFDVSTTNKTDFFREPVHFSLLTDSIIPDLLQYRKFSVEDPFIIWSAGCASGEEPYTIAMVLEEWRPAHQDFNYRIIASDISTQVLSQAEKAVYTSDKIGPIPLQLKTRYLLKSRDPKSGLIRIAPRIRSRVRFFRHNLMEDNFIFPFKISVIFCRNVVIYFDRETQTTLVRKFYNCLDDHAYLLSGHSETFCNMDIPFFQIAPTVYKKSAEVSR